MAIEKGKSVYLDLGLHPNPPMILCWPSVFTARTSQSYPNSPAKFTTSLLDRPGQPNFTVLYNAIIEVAEANWNGVVTRDAAGNVASLLENPQMFSWPFKSGDRLADEGAAKQKDRAAFRGFVAFNVGAYADSPPSLGVIQADGTPFDVPTDGSRLDYRKFFYGGVQVAASIGVRPMGGAKGGTGKAGVTLYLNTLVSYGRGDAVEAFGRSEDQNQQRTASSMFGRVNTTTGAVHVAGSPLPAGNVVPLQAPPPALVTAAFGPR